ncbi:unnamed protein product [Adineta ricciae]|uniref:Phosphatidate phosphatase APP1 catalytic domain-containing protein n=1 Tax=Adineta ricciae TaxID=249248 RepID=A0A815GZ58_ADIRI|nr:unnamed protein product [Adineta ricciae]
MTSYLRKYVTALASARDYIAQWSSDHVYADEELIVPFPTLATYDAHRHRWSVHIKAWVYLPFQPKSITSYLPSLPSFLSGSEKKEDEEKQANEGKSDKSTEVADGDNNKKKTVFNEDERSIDKSSKGDKEKVDKEKKETAAAASEENHEAKKKNGDSDSDDDMYEDALRDELGEPEENPGRLGLFFVGNSVKIATKSIINGVEHLLKPSDESGFIEEDLDFSDKEMQSLCCTTHEGSKDKKFEYQIQLNPAKELDVEKEKEKETIKENTDDYKTFTCTIYLLHQHGTSIISDIDDTVKISNVLSKRLLLKHTFYSYFKPVEGMSELYQKWCDQKCQFHYVSASPWQLYPALRCFLERYKFPNGTMNLRKFSWSLEFFKPADTYKIETISEILDSYPLRKYICVGDSGELDPEIYSKLYLKYPKSIVHIFIRDVCHTPTCLPTCEERYKKAFEEVPKERWTIFKDAKDIESDISKLLAV